ncbi:glycosyltransferase [Rahnella victoriana]|uniref:Glycosyltransferase n=1 Tax=Rahnella victoriana TaxID=1510570 RepID=A0ABS0DQ90_9GAMM|nr:glycosyltransferase [Rahnella victoriana]MBF7956060.1 glycosyltransferase [Rahnella victoriana]
MRNIGIFRHQLFKLSEIFITQQAESLTSYKPLYIGRERFGAVPQGSEAIIFNELKSHNFRCKKSWQVITRDPFVYLRALEQKQLDLMHAHFGVDACYALKVAEKKDIPLVTTFHGFDVTTSFKSLILSGSPSWMNYSVHRKELSMKGHCFIAVSDFIAEKALRLGFDEKKIIKHYIGLDVEKVKKRPTISEKKIILHVARLVEKKGTEYLIKALKKVCNVDPDYQLVIIGDGPLAPSLKSLAEKLDLTKSIQFLGSQPHDRVLELMQQASIFCLPSVTSTTGDAEGLGMVLLEAAASGVPTVGTRHGGIPEAMEENITGYLVNERDVNDLAEKLIMLVTDDKKRHAMGDSARKFIEDKFDIKKQTQILESIYEGLR